MKILYDRENSMFYTSGWIDKDVMNSMKRAGWRFNGERKYWWTKSLPAIMPFQEYLSEKPVELRKYLLSNAIQPTTENFTPYIGALPASIRKYQKAAVERILLPGDSMVCDQMGLGKTLEVITAISIEAYSANNNGKEPFKVVVVCPAHLKGVWLSEISKFITAGCDIFYFTGIRDNVDIIRIDRRTPYKVCIHVINYDILEKRLIHLEKIAGEYDYVVFDEFHYLKNLKAKRTKAAFKLCLIAKKRIFLSGTPVTKNPIDLYPTLKMMNHPLADNWYRYATTYCGAKKTKVAGREIWRFSVSNPKQLNITLRQSCMLRREKSEVLKELPAKNRQIIVLDPDEVLCKEEKEILRAERISYEDFLKKEYISFSPPVAKKLALVRQKIALYKVPAITQFCSDILESEEKIVIFAHHKAVVEALRNALAKSYTVETITGDTPLEERNKIINNFQNKENPMVIVASLMCAGTGITLTRATTAVFAELDWIPANVEQAEDRIHRIGQKDTVNIYYIVIRDTLEQYIVQKMMDRAAKIADILT